MFDIFFFFFIFPNNTILTPAPTFHFIADKNQNKKCHKWTILVNKHRNQKKWHSGMSFSNYTKAQKLGEGTYGAVFRAINNTTNEEVALKLVRMDQEDDGIPATSLREISILQSTGHNNIIHLEEIICEEGRVTMVFEFMQKDLGKYLSSLKKPMGFELIRSYSFQLLCGVYYLHKNGIIHRDIKPINLLINRSGMLKIGDFGCARICHRPFASFDAFDGILWYYAPETLLHEYPYDLAIDIWSCGCVIAEMAKREPLFKGDSQIDQINQIISLLGMPTNDSWPEFFNYISKDFPFPNNCKNRLDEIFQGMDPLLIDLISKLLEMNPRKRLTAEEAVHHPFFDTIPEPLKELCLHTIK